jgi:hypothetical protein
LVAKPCSFVVTWSNYFSQLLNEVRQNEMDTAEQLVSEPSAFEFELAIEKLKKLINHQIFIKFEQN